MYEDYLKYFKYLGIIFLIVVTLWLRFANLGYSDFQGDEIKALYLPTSGQSFTQFLFDQRKGPTQFIVTYLLNLVDPLYTNQLLLRLPFAIASALAVLFFYKLVNYHFGTKIAVYASLLFSVNGLIIAFARIVQYQSFVIFFAILALYFFTLALKEVKWRVAGLYYGMAAWGLSMLSHYDGIFIAPFVLYLLYEWFKIFPTKKLVVKLLHLFLSGLIVAAILAAFYVPFILSVSTETIAYWTNRLSGGAGKISSSIVTFKVYNPKLMFYIYSMLFGVYVLRVVSLVLAFKFTVFKGTYQTLEVFKKSSFVFLWVLFPVLFMEVITSVPGTHIYTYLIPLTILLSIGIVVIEEFVKWVVGIKLGKLVNFLGLVVFFVFCFYLTHKVFVDHTVEYPWEEERFLIWNLHKPNPIFHLSMFGFPYYRHWEEIGAFVQASEHNGYYSTNERSSISRHYIPFKKDTNTAGHYVYILKPQTFTEDVTQEKARYWLKNYSPVQTYYNNGQPVAKIYYMPAGPLKVINLLELEGLDAKFGQKLNPNIN